MLLKNLKILSKEHFKINLVLLQPIPSFFLPDILNSILGLVLTTPRAAVSKVNHCLICLQTISPEALIIGRT